MDLTILTDAIIGGKRLSREDDLDFLLTVDLDLLRVCADRIRAAVCGKTFDLCAIVNGKCGKCSENCRFCAQSAHNATSVVGYEFLNESEILREYESGAQREIARMAIVTAGRKLAGLDFEKAVSAYELLRGKLEIGLCASMGLLDEDQLLWLKRAGLNRYHCNIETSRRNFPNICTTHTYADKIACIKAAQKVGLAVCSGGIFGLGETWEDRLDMAISLAELGIDSIPINILNPIKGTPLENAPRLTNDDILRIVAIFRFVNPTARIRLAGGRGLMGDMGRAAFKSGANAAITGDMLTTSGISVETDKRMARELGYEL
ncbi:MAG: biotin synthase BioB [Thermoguttaceae bacterium]|nr:biotin synthase BioB [Thermoguttaceae bacterium]